MTDRYAVFGNPIEHSLSPRIHQMFAEQTGQVLDYRRQRVEVDAFAQTVRAFFNDGGAGLNITVPFKLEAFQLADRLTERAQRAGAVNTLYLEQTNLCGDNTDGVGLRADIENNLGWQLDRASVLLLGAGGAVRGVVMPLLQARPQVLTIANRTISKAQALVDEFAAIAAKTEINACGFDALEAPYDIVINGTSAGLSAALPPIAASVVKSANCYDMVYGESAIGFTRWCEQHGAANTSDGLGMLVEQAAESFYIWRGVRPQTKPVIESLRAALVRV